MANLAEHKIKIRYEGGLADENALPGYDGAASIDGLTRAIHIALHAYMTGEITSRATALKKASIQIRPARQGSFVFELALIIEAYPATAGIAAAIGGPMIYDFLKTALKRATGSLDAEPENRSLQNLYQRKEPPPLKVPPVDLDELAEVLEGCLQDAHRPIGDHGVNSISVGTPRQELITLDLETKDWVNTREQSEDDEILRGNVTRYNSMSRNSRVYIDDFKRIVPMRPAGDFDVGSLALLTWSLHGSNIGTHNKLDLEVRRVTSASGKVKRLLLKGCERVAAE